MSSKPLKISPLLIPLRDTMKARRIYVHRSEVKDTSGVVFNKVECSLLPLRDNGNYSVSLTYSLTHLIVELHFFISNETP
jgi:hypothetical protein